MEEGGKITTERVSFMMDVEVDYLFERSAKAVCEARIAQTGCIHFLMQACRLKVY